MQPISISCLDRTKLDSGVMVPLTQKHLPRIQNKVKTFEVKHLDIIYLHHLTFQCSFSCLIYNCFALCPRTDSIWLLSFVCWISHSHVNHFTGIVYQSVLLSQKQPVRTVSMDESVQPNTSPAQWPGESAKPNTFSLLSISERPKPKVCSSEDVNR